MKILAISGSTRKQSSNGHLIKAISKLISATFEVTLYEGIDLLPHFNPDLDNENVPGVVLDFRNQVREADGVLICTPEYAMGLPGSLKNALDWTVSSMEFSGKPVMAVTASLSGEKAHQSLLDTLRIIEANIPDEQQLLISYIKKKVNAGGMITDEATSSAITNVLMHFEKNILMNKTAANQV